MAAPPKGSLMKLIRRHIEERQSRFADIKFFGELSQHESPEDSVWFMRGLTFFVMAFQDVLRLNEERVVDPMMRIIARHHRLEDKGHDLWFLQDVACVDSSIPDSAELFSAMHASTRDVAYEIMSEVFRASDDYTRVALLLVLESTGHVFFTRVVEHLERVGCDLKLKYFARKHLEIELGHALFEQEMDAAIDAIVLDDETRERVLAAVNRSFDAMARMLNTMAERAANSVPPSRRTMPPQSQPPISVVIPRDRRASLASLYKLAGTREG